MRSFVPQSRMFSILGLTKREQIKFGENPTFPQGTEALHDEQGKLVGYRIKKGVLGIKEDIDVMLGADQKTEAVFRARKEVIPWEGAVENTYDRYLKMFHDEGSSACGDSCDFLQRTILGMVPAGSFEVVYASGNGERG